MGPKSTYDTSTWTLWETERCILRLPPDSFGSAAFPEILNPQTGRRLRRFLLQDGDITLEPMNFPLSLFRQARRLRLGKLAASTFPLQKCFAFRVCSGTRGQRSRFALCVLWVLSFRCHGGGRVVLDMMPFYIPYR